MFDSPEEISAQLRAGEDAFAEFKEVRLGDRSVVSPNTDDIACEMVAFANANGGVIFLGVDDSGTVCGLPEESLHEVESWLINVARNNCAPPIQPGIRKFLLADSDGIGRPVLLCEIRKSPYTHSTNKGRWYVRIGSQKRNLTGQELSRLFQQRGRSYVFDEQPVTTASQDDLDRRALETFFSTQPTIPWVDLLRNTKVLTTDEGDLDRPTVAGLLAFGKRVRDHLHSAYIEAAIYRGSERDSNDLVHSQVIEGTVADQIDEAIGFVDRFMLRPARKSLGREDFPQYALGAIYEAVVNAVAHRDYSRSGAKIRLYLFSDRLELYSPGELPDNLTLENMQSRVFTRNQLLVGFLSRMRSQRTGQAFLESRGEGVQRILRESEQLSGRRPEYRLLDGSELLLTIGAAPSPHFEAEGMPSHSQVLRLDLGRLPIAGPLLIGRETELARLDAAWEDPGTNVLTLVAFGGMGKSALVSHWLDRMAADGWRGAQRVLEWSFYSQGTEDRVTSADRFLDHALGWFGDPDPKAGAPRDRGLRLAELVRQEKTLLVLDGIEPLQHPPSFPLAGRLKDPGLAALLKGLAGANPGLCVVTSRERITDLESFPKAAPQEDLEALSPEAGAQLLKQLGVKGRDSELLAASQESGNHALTLTLLGGYLSRACGGDVRRRKEVDLAGADQRKGGHALRVIGRYAEWLGEGPELAVLRLLGLFNRPAGPKALVALRAKPAIPGLTEPLMDVGEEAWQLALSSLREQGLLLPADPHQPGTLDAHPLVRVFFQEELEKQRPEAWRAGNLRLYEYLQQEAPDLPDTLEAMNSLFTAVIHGCQAGRQQEAFDEVYWRRILRGNEFFSTRKLGAFGSDLAALSGFFDRPWDQPSASITSADQAFLLNEAGFSLRALGRLAEAVQPMEAGLGRYEAQENWKNAATTASNLSELTLTLGEVERAVAFGKQSVDLADRSGDAFERISNRTTLADALHQSGRWEESAAAFHEAEALQAERQPQYPRLYSLQGYRYCDLLLSRGEPKDGSIPDGLVADPETVRWFREACREVRERAEQTLKWLKSQYPLLDIALDHLSLGRAHFGLALTAPRPAASDEEAKADFAKSAENLDHAVEGLRRAGTEHNLPWGLLARAALRRLRGELGAAEMDLSEALEIAERGSMRLSECDAHLELARLCRQRGDRNGLERHVVRARRLVEEAGYGRRAREVAWLESTFWSKSTTPPLTNGSDQN